MFVPSPFVRVLDKGFIPVYAARLRFPSVMTAVRRVAVTWRADFEHGSGQSDHWSTPVVIDTWLDAVPFLMIVLTIRIMVGNDLSYALSEINGCITGNTVGKLRYTKIVRGTTFELLDIFGL